MLDHFPPRARAYILSRCTNPDRWIGPGNEPGWEVLIAYGPYKGWIGFITNHEPGEPGCLVVFVDNQLIEVVTNGCRTISPGKRFDSGVDVGRGVVLTNIVPPERWLPEGVL